MSNYMILELLLGVYILFGIGIAIDTGKRNNWGGKAFPPDVYGFMIVTLFWLPATILAIIQVWRRNRV